jgi:glycosyltransferase involved in cell wall biosynthesis
MEHQIIFSIIIPHKNIPDLLQRCLDSIPRRDDIQIIVVDDNSDEDKVDFSRFPGLDDKYVEVYLTKEGKGAGYARNVGLEHAKGKWLLFADADDFFTENAFVVFDKYSLLDNDVIYFSYNIIDYRKVQTCAHGHSLNIDQIIQFNINHKRKILVSRHWVPWAKMFSCSYIQNKEIRFEQTRVMNDAYFVVYAGIYAKKVAACIDAVYNYTVNDNSISRGANIYFERLLRFIILNQLFIKNGYFTCLLTYYGKLFSIYKESGIQSLLGAIILIIKNRHPCDLFIFHTLLLIKRRITKYFKYENRN